MIFYLAVDENQKTWIKGTQADAKALNNQFDQIDIPVDKAGLMAWVQQMLDETLNVSTETVTIATADMNPAKGGQPSISHTIPVVPESYAEKTVRFEQEWENFPLKLKCHYAALAMEECREILK